MTALQPDFDPARMGERVCQDFLDDTPGLFSAALIFFPDYIDNKANPDGVPALSIRMRFHDSYFPLRSVKIRNAVRKDTGIKISGGYVRSIVYTGTALDKSVDCFPSSFPANHHQTERGSVFI
jgi:hypothetical protein